MKRAAIYARVSTNNGQNPEMQLGELRSYCRRRGWEVGQEYVDVGVSGAKEDRPALDRLLSNCQKRLVDVVVVYRYDRYARSLRQLVNSLEDFRALGIDFISLHEGVDTSTPNGRLVFGIFASLAEFERELIRDRVRSGLAAAKAKGTRLGAPPYRRGPLKNSHSSSPWVLLGNDQQSTGNRGRHRPPGRSGACQKLVFFVGLTLTGKETGRSKSVPPCAWFPPALRNWSLTSFQQRPFRHTRRSLTSYSEEATLPCRRLGN